MSTPKYGHVRLRVTDGNGDPFSILGRLESSLRAAGVPESRIDAIMSEATADDYIHLLRTVMRTVEVV